MARFENRPTFPVSLHFFLPPCKNLARNATVTLVCAMAWPRGLQTWTFFFFLQKSTLCHNSLTFYHAILHFMGPKFILGPLMPLRKV